MDQSLRLGRNLALLSFWASVVIASTVDPTLAPSITPTQFYVPSKSPTITPTAGPSESPSFAPSASPSTAPTREPTRGPTDSPSFSPSSAPTLTPTTLAPRLSECGPLDHNDDCSALIGLYEATNRELGATGWANGTTLCEWPGVLCDVNTNRVTQLWLEYDNITGSVPDSLSGLSWLKTLYIDNNYLSGTIPAVLSSLTHLKTLYISNNSVVGSIPSELGALTMLETLYLANNNLTGTIAPTMFENGGMGRLRYLGLASNLISGTVPSTLGSLTKLRQLWLQDNKMTFWNATEICDLIDGEQLWDHELQANPFSCPLPACADKVHATCNQTWFDSV